jgi:SAM-dependent methyltransferase
MALSPADRVASRRWYHAFEILPGLITPGAVNFDAAGLLDSVGIEKDLAGQRALDIGTWDGPMAFELERRRASVVALDVWDPNQTCFNLAREILGSNVEYVRGSIYDLSELSTAKFDLVCFLGVFYHLTDPIRAFEEISVALNDTGRLFLEGECLRRYAEDVDCNPITDSLITQIANSRIPLALFPPGEYKGDPNRIIPNFACVLSWLKVARLEIANYHFEEGPGPHPPRQRIRAVARRRAPSLAIFDVQQHKRTIVVSGQGFSQRTVINLRREVEGRYVNWAGLTLDGEVRLPIVVTSPNQFHFELPPSFGPGMTNIEVCNPPYAGNEKVNWDFILND